MGKLRLDLNALMVESFDTGAGARAGTVRGHDSTEATACYAETCDCNNTGAEFCVPQDTLFCTLSDYQLTCVPGCVYTGVAGQMTCQKTCNGASCSCPPSCGPTCHFTCPVTCNL